jgi:hypothetical protein
MMPLTLSCWKNTEFFVFFFFFLSSRCQETRLRKWLFRFPVCVVVVEGKGREASLAPRIFCSSFLRPLQLFPVPRR